MTAVALQEELVTCFREGGLPEPTSDAKWLLLGILGWSTTDWLLHRQDTLDGQTVARVRTLAAQRLQRWPLQWLLGEWEFMGLSFRTDCRALIPRNDTELLAGAVLEAAPRGARLLDWGCGSGCIGLSLAKLRPDLQVTLADISLDALSLTEENRRRLGVSARLADWSMTVPAPERFDVIVSNPPYIPRADIAGLSPEVRQDPVTALDGGEDGLDFYRCLAARCRDSLVDGGLFAVECGRGQFSAVQAMLPFPLQPIDSLDGWPIAAVGQKTGV